MIDPKPFAFAAAALLAPVDAMAESDYAGAGHHSPHIIGAFAGSTDPEGAPAEFTWGLEYEYRPDDRFGIGLVAERTSDAHHGDGVDVAVGMLHYHVAHFRFSAGMGKEWVNDHGSEWLKRLGVAYDISAGPVEIAPTVAVDFIDGHEVLVYGIAVLTHFP